MSKVSWKPCLLAAWLATVANAVPLVNNLADGNGSLGGFTSTGSPVSFGQEFTPTGPESILNTLAFRMSSGTGITIRGYIQQFDALTGTTIGTTLFESAPIIVAVGGPSTFVNLFTGSLQLNSGATYIVYITAEGIAQSASNTANFTVVVPNLADPNIGRFRANLNSVNPVNGPAGAWVGLSRQLVIDATFSAPVPEVDTSAATLPLLWIACSLALLRKRPVMGS